ncbi:MAG: hypothetical protein D6809_01585 [Gammaproteobacteria bacterium]|nr:MAG: hypothetical protein D6809_01585 [Gammaproteobacteria bacterium]
MPQSLRPVLPAEPLAVLARALRESLLDGVPTLEANQLDALLAGADKVFYGSAPADFPIHASTLYEDRLGPHRNLRGLIFVHEVDHYTWEDMRTFWFDAMEQVRPRPLPVVQGTIRRRQGHAPSLHYYLVSGPSITDPFEVLRIDSLGDSIEDDWYDPFPKP